MSNSFKKIYFHVGISKTGSTFLQNRVFPLLSEIDYIPTKKYKTVFLEIEKLKNNNILISREFDRQFEREVGHFSSRNKNVVPIIVLRRHDEYFASQYRRFVKNGFRGTVKDFLNLENDVGFFKKINFNFQHQINVLNNSFEHKPVVLFYHDLKADPIGFIKKICNCMGAEINIGAINFKSKHRSYNEKQLKTVQSFSKVFDLRKRRVFKNSFLHLLWRFYHAIFRYGILYLSFFMPGFLYSKKPLIDPLYLEKIKDYFKEDWDSCLAYKNIE